MANNNHFFIRKLHSLLGVIPIGLFFLEHMFTNSFALQGPQAFNNAVAFLHKIPYLAAIEILFIFLPILIHAVYGLWIVYVARNNVLQYKYFRNWMFYLQRITAVITLLFITWHVWVLRIANALYGTEISFHTMTLWLQNPIVFVVYLIGLLAAVFHFSNGIWTFLVSWGITIGERSQRMSLYFVSIVFVVISFVGINALVAFVK